MKIAKTWNTPSITVIQISRKLMEKGSSRSWPDILQGAIGEFRLQIARGLAENGKSGIRWSCGLVIRYVKKTPKSLHHNPIHPVFNQYSIDYTRPVNGPRDFPEMRKERPRSMKKKFIPFNLIRLIRITFAINRRTCQPKHNILSAKNCLHFIQFWSLFSPWDWDGLRNGWNKSERGIQYS